MKIGFCLFVVVGFVIVGFVGFVWVVDLFVVNFGMISFFDGMLLVGVGWYGMQYLQYYMVGCVNDNVGNKVGLLKQDIDLFVGLSQFVYQLLLMFVGMYLGFDVILLWIVFVCIDDGIGNVVLNVCVGFGDLLIGLFIQFDLVMGVQGLCFVQCVEFQFIVLIGVYDLLCVINFGSYFWLFDLYWVVMLWFMLRWIVLWWLYYLWNVINYQLVMVFGLDVMLMQVGQVFYVNFVIEYEVWFGLWLGFNGYWLCQIIDMKVNGQDVLGMCEVVFVIGLGVMVSFLLYDYLLFNVYFEIYVCNWLQGMWMVLCYVYYFQ